jgi:LEA14-like dessication related protein
MCRRARQVGPLLGLLPVLLLGACAGALTSRVEPPEVSLAGVGLIRPGLFEQELRVDLRLRNPNDFDVAVDSLRFALDVNQEPFARGWTADGFKLPALGETVVPVTITVSTNDLLERVMELGTARRLSYRLAGNAKLDGFAARSIPFEREGVLALPEIPGDEPARPQSPSASSSP